ncbi:MAG: SLOG family protein [Nitrososphaerales archaeon]
MKILICGDRHWSNYWAIYDVISRLDRSSVIIHGAAKGADTTAGIIAKKLGFEVVSVPAEWEKYGRAAGPIRNKVMLDMNPDLVLAFHTDIENSKGTKNMVEIAKKKGVETIIYGS